MLLLGARRTVRFTAGALALSLSLGACGGGDDDETKALEFVEFEEISASQLPALVLDLAVTPEDPNTPLEEGQETYIDRFGFFSFRRDDLLQATLQISHFGDEARIEDESFQRLVAAQVSTGGTPSIVRVGDRRVFITSTGRQTVGVWFDDNRNMFVLSVREEYEQPRGLLRALVDLEVT